MKPFFIEDPKNINEQHIMGFILVKMWKTIPGIRGICIKQARRHVAEVIKHRQRVELPIMNLIQFQFFLKLLQKKYPHQTRKARPLNPTEMNLLLNDATIPIAARNAMHLAWISMSRLGEILSLSGNQVNLDENQTPTEIQLEFRHNTKTSKNNADKIALYPSIPIETDAINENLLHAVRTVQNTDMSVFGDWTTNKVSQIIKQRTGTTSYGIRRGAMNSALEAATNLQGTTQLAFVNAIPLVMKHAQGEATLFPTMSTKYADSPGRRTLFRLLQGTQVTKCLASLLKDPK